MPTVNRDPIYKNNTNDVVLDKLKRDTSGAYLPDPDSDDAVGSAENPTAEVVYTLYDSAGAIVSSLEDEPMDYQTGTKGKYLGIIPSTAGITVAAEGSTPNIYRIKIVATLDGVGIGEWNVYREARLRGES